MSKTNVFGKTTNASMDLTVDNELVQQDLTVLGTIHGGGGALGVTYVGFTADIQFIITGAPITDSGTINLSIYNPSGTGHLVLDNLPTIHSINLPGTNTIPSIEGPVAINNLTINEAIQTDNLKNLISIPNTGTGENVLQTDPIILDPTFNGTAITANVDHIDIHATNAINITNDNNLLNLHAQNGGINLEAEVEITLDAGADISLDASSTITLDAVGDISLTSVATTNIESFNFSVTSTTSNIQGVLTVTGDTSITGLTSLNGILNVIGPSVTWEIAGNTNLTTNYLSLEAPVGILIEATTMQVISALEVIGTLELDGASDFHGEMIVTGDATFVLDVTVSGFTQLLGECNVTGLLTCEGDINTVGAITCEGDINGLGAITCEGDGNFAGLLTCEGECNIAGNLSVEGAVEIAGVIACADIYAANITALAVESIVFFGLPL